MRRTLLCAVVLAVAACATPPPPTTEGPPPQGQAKLVVTRTDDALFLGLPAAITVNGTATGSLWRGGTLSIIVASGPLEVTAGGWSYPGKSTLRFTAEAGREYSVYVAPRGSAFFGSMFLPMMLVDAVSEDGGAFTLKAGTSR